MKKVCFLLLLGAVVSRQVGAASAMAQASAAVVEAVSVSRLLGSPLSVNEILDALNGTAGPNTGSVMLRLTSPAPMALSDLGTSASTSLASSPDEAPGTLQGEPVAAVSTLRPALAAAPPSITVAFN